MSTVAHEQAADDDVALLLAALYTVRGAPSFSAAPISHDLHEEDDDDDVGTDVGGARWRSMHLRSSLDDECVRVFVRHSAGRGQW